MSRATDEITKLRKDLEVKLALAVGAHEACLQEMLEVARQHEMLSKEMDEDKSRHRCA